MHFLFNSIILKNVQNSKNLRVWVRINSPVNLDPKQHLQDKMQNNAKMKIFAHIFTMVTAESHADTCVQAYRSAATDGSRQYHVVVFNH